MKSKYWLLIIIVIGSLIFFKNIPLPTESESNSYAPNSKSKPAPVITEKSEVLATKQVHPKHLEKIQYLDKPDPNDPRLKRLEGGYTIYKAAFDSSKALSASGDPEEAINVISGLLSDYRYAYQENPIAESNASITSNLLGNNPMKVIFLDKSQKSIVNGELVDNWGTPYFFHAESSEKMTIMSAGPDLEMWTEDDITGF